jgi:hypothetical protein
VPILSFVEYDILYRSKFNFDTLGDKGIMVNFETYKKDLDELINLGKLMMEDIKSRKGNNKEYKNDHRNTFETEYQNWYTITLAVVKQIIPHRFNEFESLYLADPKRKVINRVNFTIQDWLNGYRLYNLIFPEDCDIDDIDIVILKFQTQKTILESASHRFENSLFDIRKIVQAELFDSEIDSANELLKNGYLRAAGAIVGVLLEKHLNDVCENHMIKVNKKTPCISDYNNLLKDNNVIELHIWRFIQRLGDIRNLCDHKKDYEPEKNDVIELVKGVEKILKTII